MLCGRGIELSKAQIGLGCAPFVGPFPGTGWSRNRPGGLGGLTRLEEMKVLVCAGDEEAVREKLEQGMETSTCGLRIAL